jgi:peptidoglycan hydrolase CwlO-like protein
MDIEKLKTLKQDLQTIVNTIATERDKLRDLVDEAADILASLDDYTELQDEAMDVLRQYL